MKKHEAEKLIETIRGFVDGAIESIERTGIPGPGKIAAPEDQARIKLKPGAVKPNGQNATLAEIDEFLGRPPFDARRGLGETPPFDEEALYQRFRARFIDEAQMDPVLCRLIMVQPEIIIEYERRTETPDASSLRGRILKLIATDFLNVERTNGNVVTELRRTGTEPNSRNVSRTLADLVSAGFLTRSGAGFMRAPGVKVSEKAVEVHV